jgi:uncharacterized protein
MNAAAGSTGRGAPVLHIEDLLRPEAFDHAVTRLDVRETQISWVILTGPFAYKIKKPARFESLGGATLEQRRHYCEEELRLNRRLAPELYLDVVPITHAEGHPHVGGPGPVVEYAVRMKQFDADDELSALLERNNVSLDQVTALAELLARFHREAPVASRSSSQEDTQEAYASVLGNLAELAGHLKSVHSAPDLSRLVDWTCNSARALEETFISRERSGCVRECHGDLHAGNIVLLQHRLVPFDCLVLDPKMRWIDVINDIAFLIMDLVSWRRADLAFVLLSRYLECSGDYEGIGLLRFYAVHRALVRATIDALGAERVPVRAAQYRERLRRRVQSAKQWLDADQPTLIVVHGPSGSEKSCLSERLVPALHAVRIRSDLERRRLAGIDVQESVAPGLRYGIYSPGFNHRTYSRLLDCTEHCLRVGFNVIVDAAFWDAADRELFQALATRLRAHFLIVSCQPKPAGQFEPREQAHVITVNAADPAAIDLVSASCTATVFQPNTKRADLPTPPSKALPSSVPPQTSREIDS